MWIEMIFIIKITKRWYDVNEEMICRLGRYMWGFGSVLTRMVKIINAILCEESKLLIMLLLFGY